MNEHATNTTDWCLPGEQWRPVVSYDGIYRDGYEVSDFARARGIDRHVPHAYYGRQFVAGRILAQHPIGHSRYMGVSLTVGDVTRARLVHVLVAEAFLGERPGGLEVCHGPAGRLDNRPANLSWGDHSSNMRDQRRDGTNYELNKTHCPRMHILAPPNLVPGRAARGQRICKACARARATVHNARTRHGITLDFLVEADRHYALIVGTAAA